MPWYSPCSLLLFSFWTKGKKRHLDENKFCSINFFFENGILKITWSKFYVQTMFKLCSYYVQSSFSAKNSIENSSLKDTLQLNILWTWIHIRAKSFIKTSANIMKQKSMNCLKEVRCTKIQAWTSKNMHLSRSRVIYFIRFLFFQT